MKRQFRVTGIDQIHVAIVAESKIFGLYVVAHKVKHGEIAVGTLGLTTVAGNHHIFGIIAKTYKP